jgi:hypothetical protein
VAIRPEEKEGPAGLRRVTKFVRRPAPAMPAGRGRESWGMMGMLTTGVVHPMPDEAEEDKESHHEGKESHRL